MEDPNVLHGYRTADDAGVYRLSADLALVQTVDFFPPVVDDPFAYGSIAAANSLSDIYAMGAKPVSALNVLGFPRKKMSNEDVEEILRGASKKTLEANCPIIGGHTIEAPEPFFGLCVTGAVHPERFITNGGGRAGDVLVLTKPLGTGVITTAAKAGLVTKEVLERATEVMNTLNRSASEAMLRAGAT
ncbi:MAG: selenide, water dikinase SelD, partial [bacterium]